MKCTSNTDCQCWHDLQDKLATRHMMWDYYKITNDFRDFYRFRGLSIEVNMLAFFKENCKSIQGKA